MIVENTGSVNITQSTLSSARNIPSNRSFDSFFMITQANIHIGNSVFIGSSKGATALWIVNSVLRLEGAVTFVNSSGVLGGALRLTASRVIASGNVSVQFEDNHAQYGSAIYIDNTSCPLVSTEDGFLGKCECLSSLHNEGTFVCSSGIACLAADHWIGQIESSNGVNSFLLGDSPNSRCSSDRGGLLCRGCRDGHCFTHAPSRCVARTSEGAAIALILLSVFIHLVKAVVIIVMLSREQMDIKILNSVGSGPIYSALFFLGFVGRIPFDTLSQYRALQDIVSAFRSVILPTLDIISEIPVCILPSSSSGFLYLTGLRYLGVASLVFILLIYNAMLCCWSRVANQLQTSPLKSICLLILWGYYLVVTTSIDILKANSLSELDEVRVAIQPELVYFRGTPTPEPHCHTSDIALRGSVDNDPSAVTALVEVY
eukprot:Em1362g1a